MIALTVWPLLVGIPFFAVGVVLLSMFFSMNKPTVRSRYRLHALAASIVALSVGAAGIGAQFYIMYDQWDRSRHVDLHYDVALSVNGTGRVLVSLPVPTTEALYANLQSSPSSSTLTINFSRDEPTLDVEMSENTTIHGAFRGLWDDIPVDMTLTTPSSTDCWPSQCTSEVSVLVLYGSVADVHIVLEANWGSWCKAWIWDLQCYAVPGISPYHGDWGQMVC